MIFEAVTQQAPNRWHPLHLWHPPFGTLGTLAPHTREFEKRFITRVIEKSKGNLCKVADTLGVHRNTRARKMKELKIRARNSATSISSSTGDTMESFRRAVFTVVAVLSLLPKLAAGQTPVPEFYGFYALDGGVLKEMKQDPEFNDYGPAVRFVVFAKEVALGQPIRKMFFIPPAQTSNLGDGQFRGWDDFLKQSRNFGDAMDLQMQYGVPANAAEVSFRVGPYGDSREMIRVVPSADLPPGHYSLTKGVRFWVNRSAVAAAYAAGERTPAATPVAPRAPEANVRRYPRSSGQGTTTRVVFDNDGMRTIQLFLDESSTPIEIKGARTHTESLEMGSVHLLKAVVGGQTFQAEFVVRVTRPIVISTRGILVR